MGHHCHPGRIHGTIQEYWKGKSALLLYGAGRKKRKSDSSQPVKKGKRKQIESFSKSEEVLESDDDDEIEAMFAEDSESEQEKWA